MFCGQCGMGINEGSKFCNNCGAPVRREENVPKKEVDSGEPLLVLSPVFVGSVTLLSMLPATIFFTIWGGGFFGGFSMFAVRALGLNLPGWFTFVFFGLLFLIGIPAVFYTAKKKTYALTKYRFFRDRLEYMEGFWTMEDKTVRYDRVAEISMRRGVIQRRYGLGCVFLATPAAGFSQGKTASGIVINDIENPEKVYSFLQQLLHK